MQASQLALSPTPSLPPIPSATALTPTAPTPLSTITTIPLSTERAATPIAAKNGWQKEYADVSVEKMLVQGATEEEIATLLFAQYLAHYQTPDADSRSRLLAYEIINMYRLPDDYYLDIRQDKKLDTLLGCIYSVKPYVFLFSNWNAGNGITTDNYSWIRNKFLIIGIGETVSDYFLDLIGTG
jgi:hypothetical protein